MKEKELINIISEKAEIKKYEAEKVLGVLKETIVENCKKGEKLKLHKFGTFEGIQKSARDCRNPKTGETIHVPEHIAPKFTFSDTVKKECKDM